MSKNKNAHHDDHRPNVGLYVKVFAALMVLTVVTVAISKLHMPRPQAIALGLFVASIKATLVGALFMHLWGEKKLIHKFLYVTVACAAILILPLIDCALIVRQVTERVSVGEQHPGGHEGGHGSAEPTEKH